MTDIKVCSQCVMDTSDPAISFDANGVCNHCLDFRVVLSKSWFPNDEGKRKWQSIVEIIKRDEKNKPYDCILGLSGGIDSSYLAIKVLEVGLRPLVIHVDGGWNSELAVQNIEKVVKYCGWDLHTIVIDWEEMRDLQLAYMKSGIANQDVPQDHAFFASIYHYATKHKIRYILSGGNLATESIFPRAWHWAAMDAINLRAIHKKYGKVKLKKYKTISFFEYYFYYPFFKRMKTVRPLNFMPYVKSEALDILKKRVGYKEYERKHGESIFTKFFQNYYLPMKFGYDKRKPHLSSLIVSGQITRDQALSELQKPLFVEKELISDKEYVAKKLGVSLPEFEEILKRPSLSYRDFPNMERYYTVMKKVQATLSRVLGRGIENYS